MTDDDEPSFSFASFMSDWQGHVVRAFVLLCLFLFVTMSYAMCEAFT